MCAMYITDFKVWEKSNMTQRLNFSRINQGANFLRVMRLLDTTTELPIDLTGFSAKMQIRYRTPQGSLIATLDSESESPYITFDAENGLMNFDVPAAVTKAWRTGTVVYDLELTYPDGKVDRLFEGTTSIVAEVTQDV